MHRTKGILVVLWFCSFFSSFAETLNFKNYTVKDGLANSTVYDVFQDSRGFLWFATESGVNRFDGHRFELFTMDNGLSDNEVLQIREDSKGRIWFLTLNGKLSYYHNRKFCNTASTPVLKESVNSGSFISFYEDSKKRLWFSTNQNLLLCIDAKNKISFYKSTGNSLANCSVSENENGDIIALGKDQFFLLKNGVFTPISVNDYPLSDKSVLTGPDHSLLILSDKGLMRYQKNRFTPVAEYQNMQHISAGSFLIDHQEKLWVSTMGQGILLYKNDNSKPENYLKGSSITCIMRDSQQNIWISTIGNGVYMLPAYYAFSTHFTTSDGLSSNAVHSIIKAGDQLILGLRSGNLDMISPKGITHRKFNSENTYNPVKQLHYDSKRGSVWYASDNRLIETGEGRPENNILKDRNKAYALKSFSINNNGDIALALASGVYVIGKNSSPDFDKVRNASPHSPFHNRAFKVYYSSDNTLWFSNILGLHYYEHDRVTALYKRYPVLSQRITDIAELPGETLICASYGFGIFILKDKKLQKIITTDQGLASNICKKIISEKNTAWVVTGKGISRIDFNGDIPSVKNYDTEHGLISDEVNDLFAENDTVYAATNNGVTIFKPSSGEQRNPPAIYLKSLQANKAPFKPGRNTYLPYTTNNITVSYIALDYTHPDQISYSYRLNGQTRWAETQGNTIEFGSLESGIYRLEIRARSLNTGWSKPVAADFIIRPPIWKTWWFISLCILSASAGLFILIRNYYRTRQMEEKEKLLVKTRIISLEQQALQAMMNPHFIFNVMNSIQYFINTRDNTMANQMLTGFARLIRKNLDICNKSYISVEEEISYLSLYLSLEKLRFGDKMEYRIETDNAINVQETYIPSMLLQPYVENAIWHGIMPSDHKGNIAVLITLADSELKIRIIDDGVGIGNSVQPKSSDHVSRGMKLTAQRVSLLNKFRQHPIRINVHPVPSGGTEVSIQVPVKPFTH